jgi:hypothetical protein
MSLYQREVRTPYNNIDEAKIRSKRSAGELSGDKAAGNAKATVDKAADKAGIPR